MTENPSLREEDLLILQQIQDGNDDVQKITENTLLENHQVNYAFQKLEEHGLIHVTKPEGYIKRTINGQKRVFQHPKQAELTQKARSLLEESDQEDLEQYQDLTREELIQHIHELEQRINDLEQSFKIFQQQVQKELN
jgi:predicted transcriptional regulator